jgi:hypothetical protein
MTKKSNWQHKSKILLTAGALAIAVHLCALLYVKDIKIDYYSPNKASMENHMTSQELLQQQSKKHNNKTDREEQLAQAFKSIEKEQNLIQKVTFDIDGFDPTTEEQDLEAFTYDPTLEEKAKKASHEPIAMQVVLSNPESDIELAFDEEDLHLADESSIQLLFSDDNQVAQDLLKAREIIKGDVLPQNTALADAQPTLQAGALDSDSLSGNSTENRSGLLDSGNDNSDNTLIAGVLSPKEIASIKESLGARETESEDLTYNNDFNLSVAFSPNTQGKGYFFRATLLPKAEKHFHRIKQNIFFIIDRSYSISRARYDLTKKAVAECLSNLSEQDSFNILIFDSNVVEFSPTTLPAIEQNIEAAKEFLAKQEYGGIFASTDLYGSLNKVIPKTVAENEVNTAILFSDGDTYMKAGKQRASLKKLNEQNTGKVSLYCIVSESGDNISLLDLISTFNKGSIQTASNIEQIPTTLEKLLQSIHTPILKDIVATAVTKEKNAIALYPPTQYLQNMYKQSPFTIYGTVERPEEFYLFLQGKYYDKWVSIKQKISFSGSQNTDNEDLKEEWAVQQAHNEYKKFLDSGNLQNVENAKNLLAPYKIPIAF